MDMTLIFQVIVGAVIGYFIVKIPLLIICKMADIQERQEAKETAAAKKGQ